MRAARMAIVAGLLLAVVGSALLALPVAREYCGSVRAGLFTAVVRSGEHRALAFLDDTFSHFLSPFRVFGNVETFTVGSTVREWRGRAFDLYVFDRANYELWRRGLPYRAYLEVRNVSLYSFSLPVEEWKLADLLFVFSNAYTREYEVRPLVERVVRVAEWFAYNCAFVPLPEMLDDPANRIAGSARELRNRSFDLIVFDIRNYELWRRGLPHRALYEARNVSSCSFSFPVAPAMGGLCFIVRRTGGGPGEGLEVLVSAVASYARPVEIYVDFGKDLSWYRRSPGVHPSVPELGRGLLALGILVVVVTVAAKGLKKLRMLLARGAAESPREGFVELRPPPVWLFPPDSQRRSRAPQSDAG